MSDYKVQASYKAPNDKGCDVNLSLISYKEGELSIIYSPALDLFGYGNSEDESIKSFEVTLEEFLKYTCNKQTIEQELQRLGWKIQGNKKRKNLIAPNLEELLRDNEMLHDIVTSKEFHKFHKKVEVPVFA